MYVSPLALNARSSMTCGPVAASGQDSQRVTDCFAAAKCAKGLCERHCLIRPLIREHRNDIAITIQLTRGYEWLRALAACFHERAELPGILALRLSQLL